MGLNLDTINERELFERANRASEQRFANAIEDIIRRYEEAADEDDDEVNIATGEIYVDRGWLRNAKPVTLGRSCAVSSIWGGIVSDCLNNEDDDGDEEDLDKDSDNNDGTERGNSWEGKTGDRAAAVTTEISVVQSTPLACATTTSSSKTRSTPMTPPLLSSPSIALAETPTMSASTKYQKKKQCLKQQLVNLILGPQSPSPSQLPLQSTTPKDRSTPPAVTATISGLSPRTPTSSRPNEAPPEDELSFNPLPVPVSAKAPRRVLPSNLYSTPPAVRAASSAGRRNTAKRKPSLMLNYTPTNMRDAPLPSSDHSNSGRVRGDLLLLSRLMTSPRRRYHGEESEDELCMDTNALVGKNGLSGQIVAGVSGDGRRHSDASSIDDSSSDKHDHEEATDSDVTEDGEDEADEDYIDEGKGKDSDEVEDSNDDWMQSRYSESESTSARSDGDDDDTVNRVKIISRHHDKATSRKNSPAHIIDSSEEENSSDSGDFEATPRIGGKRKRHVASSMSKYSNRQTALTEYASSPSKRKRRRPFRIPFVFPR